MLKLLKENIGTAPPGRGTGKNVPNSTPIAQTPAPTVNNGTTWTIKASISRRSGQQRKQTSTEWGKNLTNHAPDSGITARTYKEFKR